MQRDQKDCRFCGTRLKTETPKRHICSVCGSLFETNYICANDHTLCQKCNELSVTDIIKIYCMNHPSTDPMETAMILLRIPDLPIHGDEHIFLITAVLLTAYYNKKKDFSKKIIKIKNAYSIYESIPDNLSALLGFSMAGIGVSLFISLITDGHPDAESEWRLSNLMMANALESFSHFDKVFCAKRDTYLGLIEAINFLRENFDMLFTHQGVICEFAGKNSTCMGPACPFYATRFGRNNLL